MHYRIIILYYYKSMNNILFQKYDLFVFDLDNTLIKSEHLHYQAWLKTLQEIIGSDFFISETDFFSIFHSMIQNNIENYLSKLLNKEDCTKAILLKKKNYYEIINENKKNIELIDGVKELLELIILNQKEFVIVSNALKEQIDFYTELFPILKFSSKNYYREMYQNKKPNSECYEMVVNDFLNKRMIGFEDSITGIHALTNVKNITAYFINSINYYHYQYIMNNYKVKHINNYFDLLLQNI